MAAISPDTFWIDHVSPAGTVLQTRYRNSSLTLGRFVHDGHGVGHFQGPAEDAFVAVIQVSDLPEHEFCLDQKAGRQHAGSSEVFNFADLRSVPYCRIADPVDHLHLHIPRAALDDIADEADSPAIAGLRAPDGWNTYDPIVQNIKQTLIAATERGHEVSQLFVDHMMLALHAHFARTYGGMRDGQRLRRGGLAPWQERRAKEMIASSLTSERSIAEIADECGLSIAHFSRAFKETTGLAPHAWLQVCRVERAKELLLSQELSLAEIALACGFADQSHFSRVFARIAGDTPGAWRRYRRAA